MKNNPYSMTVRDTQVATTMRLPISDSKESFIGHNGEVNASSKAELMSVIASLIDHSSAQGGVYTEDAAVSKVELAKKHHDMVTASFSSNEQLAAVGETLADELYVTSNRDGFMRRFLARQEVAKGSIPTVRMKMKNTVAVIASGPSQIETQLIRDNDYYPAEFYISARPYIEQRDINRSSGDILEEKYIEALEGIMVSEDRTWKKMAEATVGISNGMSNFVGQMTPTALGQFRNLVTRWGIPASTWLIANDLWTDLLADVGFQAIIDPVSKHELLLSGQLGDILGMTIVSDSFRHEEHKVLSKGEQYIIGSPINHGTYSDRGGIDSLPIDHSIERIPGRGWSLTESVSMIIANPRSVAKGQRV